MEAFLIENIVSKLQVALYAFDIHPYNQQLDCWNWVNAWSDVLPLPTLVELLNQYFFPRWLLTLTIWIKMNPNYEHICNWYSGWKSLMPTGIFEHPTIKGRFRSALNIMSQPRSWWTLYAASSSTIYSGLAEGVGTASLITHDFKELVQKLCDKRGILWMLIFSRFRGAKKYTDVEHRYKHLLTKQVYLLVKME